MLMKKCRRAKNRESRCRQRHQSRAAENRAAGFTVQHSACRPRLRPTRLRPTTSYASSRVLKPVGL